MRVCLSMIVKNEAHVIERCLRSVRPHIQSWAISDTGSSDGTQDIIRRVMADMPGELIERPWSDFSTNRNHALELAKKYGDYALILDADDTIRAEPFEPLSEDLYDMVVEYGSLSYKQPHLVRLAKNFFYTGVTHEYIDCAESFTRATLNNAVYVIGQDGARRISGKKFEDDAAILRKALQAEPDNARYWFYLAQSLRDAGNVQEALDAYRKRIVLGGWAEEVYYSMVQIAGLLERLHAEPAQITQAYLEAYDYRPTRAEAPCYLAAFWRLRRGYFVARDFARIAAALKMPDDRLFLDANVYDWRARDELAVAQYWCGDKAESERLCRELLADARLPASERERMQKNLDFATGRA